MPKHLIPILVLIIVWLGFNQSTTLACCPPPMAPNENLEMADVVFAGKVITANQEAWRINRIRLVLNRPFILLTEDIDRYRTTFEVTKVWKGDVTARTHILHSVLSSVGYSFRQGNEYIVYASRFGGELQTDQCFRNNPLSAAGEDLLALGAGKPPAPNPSSLSDLTRRLAVLSLLLGLFGWAIWQARRKYGVQKS
jgi:hypothetical protein